MTEKLTFAPWDAAFAAQDDMPADLFFAAERQADELTGIRCGGTTVGVALRDAPFFLVYILPAYRRQGLGTAAATALVPKLPEKGMTAYRSSDPGAAAFAASLGFRRKYASACMVYTGAPFSDADADVRAYADADYPAAQALYAEAFHRMRVSVGDFPDSTVEQPSEEQRREWAETAETRLMLLHEGGIAGVAHIVENELGSVAVAPELQRRGLGRAFVKTLCNRILSAGHASVVLYCVEGNGARRLYDALGFEVRSSETYAVRP